MKGLIGSALPALLLAVGLTTGCTPSKNLYDPCYPERYWASSRGLVNDAFAPQVNNGHVLDQTIFNEAFDPGTDKLNQAGLQHLSYLARRRPQPDPILFLQTAQDLPYEQASPQLLATARGDLDARRKAAIEGFLGVQANGPTRFQVVVHDPGDVGVAGTPLNLAIQSMYTTRFSGGLSGTGGTATSGGGGGGVGGR